MSARLRRVLFAAAAVTVACNGILGNESSITYVDEDAGGAATDASADAFVPDALDGGSDASDGSTFDVVEGDANVAPCGDVDAAICRDFDPPASAPLYGFASGTSPPFVTNPTTSTTMPFSLGAELVSGGADRVLGMSIASTVAGYWELDLQIVAIPAGGSAHVAVFELPCTATENVRIGLVDTALVLDAVDLDGGTTATAAGPTLPLARWRHLRLEVEPATVTLTTNAMAPAVLVRSCSASTVIKLGLFDSSPTGRSGQWAVLFDSFRYYP